VGLHLVLVIKSNRLTIGFYSIISSVYCNWTCIILFEIREGDFTTLLQEGRTRATVETLELVFNEEDNYNSFSPEEIWRKYPNLKNVNGARREMKRFLKGFGKKGRLETFHLTFFNKLSDDIFGLDWRVPSSKVKLCCLCMQMGVVAFLCVYLKC
jgi:hypothetical protein